MIGGVMGVAHYQCKQLLGQRYCRVDTFFDRGVNLDDPRPKTLDYLEDRAKSLDLDEVLDWLETSSW
ncbi:MAG: hypothetical protein GY719_24370 [bacterium]|nr:hypothetical protein [bacterium]